MTLEALVEPDATLPSGEARFIRSTEAKALLAQSEQDGYVRIDIPELRPALRGRLSWLLEEAIERSLELRGACSPGFGASANLELSLTDQLYRARLIGARGFVIALPTLEGLTNRSGALDADDSTTLRWWIQSARQRPIRLYLDVADCMLGAYLDPITLAQLLHSAVAPMTPVASPPVVVEWVDSAVATAQDSEELESGQEAPVSDVVASARNVMSDSSPQLLDRVSNEELDEPQPTETTLEPVALEPSIAPPAVSAPIDSAAIVSVGDDDTNASEPESADVSLTPIAAPTADDLERASAMSNELPDRPADGDRREILPIPHPATIPAPQMTASEEPAAPAEIPPHRPLHVDAPNAWRSWMQRLEAARGPKPLNAIEQLFINAYVPLQDAYQRGIASVECRPVLDNWAMSFAKSYAEAFDALRLRGRRPMMVLDIPEAAQRLARLHGARSVQLVLVDGLRFDLGLRMESRLASELGQHAILTDRFLLWSALPTTTAQQLELIARGPEGLRDGDIHTETPVPVARGRSASTLRRVRAGNRELLKLDLVEARLGEPGGPLAERLDDLGVELGDALAAALGRMPPRTLVAVFGDHGFCLDSTDSGSGALRQGGASPEEVLVPGFAWLVGQTH